MWNPSGVWLMKAQLSLILIDSWTQHCVLLPIETVNLEERSHCKEDTNTRNVRHIPQRLGGVPYWHCGFSKTQPCFISCMELLGLQKQIFLPRHWIHHKGFLGGSRLLIMQFSIYSTKRKADGADLLSAFFQTPEHQLRFKKVLDSLLWSLWKEPWFSLEMSFQTFDQI